MSFLNVLLLGGGLAFTVPLLIHLLTREKFQRVNWGAMLWLETTEPVNSRFPHWSTWLLLLNRIAIPILLAVCLARPVLTAFRSSVAAESSALSIVVDNSLSMKVRNPATGLTAFDEAKQLIASALEYERARGQLSEVSVYTTTDSAPAVDTTTEFSRASSAIARLAVVHDANRPEKSLRAAAERLSQSEAPRHRLLVISDFQSARWKAARREIAALVSPVELTGEQKVTPNLDITLAQISNAASAANAFIHANPLPTLLPNTPVVVRAQVLGLEEGAESTATVFVDGREMRRLQVVGNAANDVSVEFAFQFAETGDHRVKLQLDCIDAIEDDNSAYLAVRVARARKIALIADSTAQPILDFVETALAPFADSGQAQNRFRTQRIATNELTPTKLSRDEYETAILVLGEPLSQSASAALLDFVRSGGGLLAFPNVDTATSWWNDLGGSSDTLLPFRYTAAKKLAVEGLAIAPGLPGSLASLGRALKSAFSRVRLEQASSLLPRSTTPQNPAIPILLTPAGPALVTQTFGAGRVVQFSFSPGRESTNLHLLPAFVPLMQELVAFSSEAERSRLNVLAGEQVVNRSGAGNPRFEPMDVPVAEDSDQATEAVHYAGFYGTEVAANEEKEAPAFLAAQIPIEESRLEFISDPDMDKWASGMNARRIVSAQEFTSGESQLRDGKEVWRWLLLAVICLLVTEIWLSGQVTRGGQ